MAVLITLLIGLMGILMGTDDINEDDAGALVNKRTAELQQRVPFHGFVPGQTRQHICLCLTHRLLKPLLILNETC